jgi:uncharacterized protein (TIGR02246 family)
VDGNEEARQVLLGIVARLREGWNRHDAQAFAAPFAEDADFTNVFGIVAKGRKQVETAHAAIFRTIFKDSCWTKTDTAVRFLRPDVAVLDIRWELEGSSGPWEGASGTRFGLMNLIVTREGANWAIAVFHNQDVPAPEQAKRFADLWKQ